MRVIEARCKTAVDFTPNLESVKQASIKDNSGVLTRLLTPARLYTRDEVLDRPSPVPKVAGVYAWYFDELPPGADASGCHATPHGVLLYVGIAPKEPPRKGTAPSTQTLGTGSDTTTAVTPRAPRCGSR